MADNVALSRFEELLEELGVRVDPQLLELALTHRSWAYENGGVAHNERLEFLGDAVLEVVVTDHLYRDYPDLPEGRLAKMRAAVVNTHVLADVSRSLAVGPMIKLGQGEVNTQGWDKTSILADAMESLIGALWLTDRPGAVTFVSHLFLPLIDEAAHRGPSLEWKTSLQEATAAAGLGAPIYEIAESGPEHARTFHATVFVAGEALGQGESTTKRGAEMLAAGEAFQSLSPRTDA